MGKKYLFSPVGNTDPIKYFHDGSLPVSYTHLR